MDKKIIIGIIVAVVALGGVYIALQGGNDDKMMEKKAAGDTMMKDDAPKKENAMMESNHDMKKDGEWTPEEMEAMKKDDTMMEKEGAMMMKGGQYVAYDASKLAFAKEGKVVLFFNASWCPSCKAIDADIKASLKDIPADTLILSVDYDTNKDLKTKYGVTTQHTFVQVDADGKSLGKWIGGDTLEYLLSNVE
jgi:thiol-disulfide isomerase/thioredoxin